MNIGDRVRVIAHNAIGVIEDVNPIIVRFTPFLKKNGATLYRFIGSEEDVELLSPPKDNPEWSDLWEKNSK